MNDKGMINFYTNKKQTDLAHSGMKNVFVNIVHKLFFSSHLPSLRFLLYI